MLEALLSSMTGRAGGIETLLGKGDSGIGGKVYQVKITAFDGSLLFDKNNESIIWLQLIGEMIH